jgi:uncharacterized OsmC-like protein
MVKIKPKNFVDQTLTGTCPTHSRSDITTRDVGVIIDEPVARGGTNQGLSPTETVIAALVGCTNVIANKIAQRDGIEVREFSVEAVSTFDRRGVTLAEEIDIPFPKVVLTVNITTPAAADQVEHLKSELSRFCPVSKMLRQSGTRIEEVWNVTEV